jgi:hypothetical protein
MFCRRNPFFSDFRVQMHMSLPGGKNSGEKGHMARDYPKIKAEEEKPNARGQQQGPMVLMPTGDAFPANSDEALILDSGATHHNVCQSTHLRNMRYSAVCAFSLGGGESHPVRGEGDVIVYNGDTDMNIILTGALFVPSLACNLCSGAQLNTKGLMCEQKGARMTVKLASGKLDLCGERVNNLHYLDCGFVLPAEGQAHVTLHACHNRVSHPSLSTLKGMARKKFLHGLRDPHNEPGFT